MRVAKLTANFIRGLINSGRKRDMYDIAEGGSTMGVAVLLPLQATSRGWHNHSERDECMARNGA